MGLGEFKCVDLSANVFPFLVTNVAYLISASRLTERADVATGASQHSARLCHEGHPHKFHFTIKPSGWRNFYNTAGKSPD